MYCLQVQVEQEHPGAGGATLTIDSQLANELIPTLGANLTGGGNDIQALAQSQQQIPMVY